MCCTHVASWSGEKKIMCIEWAQKRKRTKKKRNELLEVWNNVTRKSSLSHKRTEIVCVCVWSVISALPHYQRVANATVIVDCLLLALQPGRLLGWLKERWNDEFIAIMQDQTLIKFLRLAAYITEKCLKICARIFFCVLEFLLNWRRCLAGLDNTPIPRRRRKKK